MRGMLKSGPALRFAILATMAAGVAGYGGSSEFKNDPRAPAPVQLTGVIRDDKVTVSPNRGGGGPIILLIPNQPQQAHTIALDGVDTQHPVGPITPSDTAKLQ